MIWWIWLIITISAFLAGLFIGLVVVYRLLMSKMKSSSLITEEMIRILASRITGRSLSESQLRQITRKIREEQIRGTGGK